MNRKLVCLLLALTVLLCACGEEPPAWSGSGTAEDPYRIENAAQLRRMGVLINDEETAEQYASAHYRLTADIELGGSARWTPIGTERHPFSGVLDGDGHSISGIRIDYRDPLVGETSRDFALIGNLQGTVKNLTIRNSRIHAEGAGNIRSAAVAATVFGGCVENCHAADSVEILATYHAAGICANLNGDSTLRGCTSAATVSATGNVGCAAGIAVYAHCPIALCTNTGTIHSAGDGAGIAVNAGNSLQDCRNEGAVTAEKGYAAGIVCHFSDGALNHRENDASVTLLRCTNTGDICSESDPAGGIAVRCSTGQIVDCVNEGSVTSPMEAGGIFAYFNQSAFGAPCARFTVSGCENSGAITNSADAPIYSVGGICGILYGSTTDHVFENCRNSGNIRSGEAAGGIIGSCDGEAIRISGCVNTGTITGVGVCGGIVGTASPWSEDSGVETVFLAEHCRNEGALYVKRDGLNFGASILLDSYAGGILGRCWSLPENPGFTHFSIENCENTGSFDGENTEIHFFAHDFCPAEE